MGKTAIEWADVVWNPVVGCTPASEGCINCYARALHEKRHAAVLNGAKLPKQYEQPFGMVQCLEERLEDPLHWKKPQRIFVNSVSDLFHPDVPFEFIWRVFAVMHNTPHQTFIVLSKRPQRMLESVKSFLGSTDFYGKYKIKPFLSNVWLGTSISSNRDLWMVEHLLRTPAAVRFVSVEPMLGPVDLTHDLDGYQGNEIYGPHLDWVICGGETGPNARPMHPNWVRSLRDQCQETSVPFFFKSWGEWTADFPQGLSLAYRAQTYFDHREFYRIGKKLTGRLLDGREWNEFPEGK